MTPRSTRVRHDADGRLDGDLACVNCGHNLRGLRSVDPCTECGTPIQLSFCGSALNASDPTWVRHQRLGVATISLTMIWLWLPPAWLVLGYGVWRLTTPKPQVRGWLEQASLCIGRVVLAWVFPALLAVILADALLGAYEYSFLDAVGMPDGVLAVLADIIACVVFCVVLLKIAAVARLAHSRRLRRLAVLGAACCLIALAMATLWLTQISRPVYRQTFDFVPALTVLSTLAGLGALAVVLIVAWQLLHVAEVQARALRDQPKVWRRPTPGARWQRSATARPGGGERADDPG